MDPHGPEVLLQEKADRKDDRDKKRADRQRRHLQELSTEWEPDLKMTATGSNVRYEPVCPPARENRHGEMEKDWRQISHKVMARYKPKDKTMKKSAQSFPFTLAPNAADFEFENMCKNKFAEAAKWCEDQYCVCP